MEEKVERFLNELRNYSKNKKEIERLENEADVLLYDMTGVKGVRYDKIGGSTNQLMKDLRKLDQIERLNKIYAEIRRLKANNDYIERILEMMEPKIRQVCLDIYCEGKTFESACRELGYSSGGLWKRINRAIWKSIS